MIDALDKKLIKELQGNGRSSYLDLAKKLGKSVSTISRRVDRLLDNGIIKVVAIPNTTKIGYSGNAVIALNVELAKINGVCEKLIGFQGINFVAVSFGRFDVICFANFDSSEEMSSFIMKDLSSIEGVKQVETLVISGIKKHFGWIMDTDPHSTPRKRALQTIRKRHKVTR